MGSKGAVLTDGSSFFSKWEETSMTVKELIKLLNQYPGDMEVVDDFYLDVEDAKIVEVEKTDQKVVMIC